MAVRTEAEQDQIEARKVTRAQFEEAAEFFFVISGGCGGVGIFREYTIHIPGGNWNFRQHRFIHHAVVAVGVVGRDVTLVAEK